MAVRTKKTMKSIRTLFLQVFWYVRCFIENPWSCRFCLGSHIRGLLPIFLGRGWRNSF
jgi:hypothetical protein